MNTREVINSAQYWGLYAFHAAAYPDSPYADIDAYTAACKAAHFARVALSLAEAGLVVDPVTLNCKPGTREDCTFGDVWIASIPCESQVKGAWQSDKAVSRNRLRVDAIESGSPRCINMNPAGLNAIRWLGSGGSAFVFGFCVGRGHSKCPLNQEAGA